MRYKRMCNQLGLEAREMPVPRTLSSSCGTCVSYYSQDIVFDDKFKDEIEQIVKVTDTGYENIYSSEE